jgi:hypothetical protein
MLPSLFRPETEVLLAKFMNLTTFDGHFTGLPADRQLTEPETGF